MPLHAGAHVSHCSTIRRTVELFARVLLVTALPLFPLAAQGSRDPQPVLQGGLEINRKDSASVRASTVHRWTLDLTAKEYVEVEVVQHGIDLIVRLLTPSGAVFKEFDDASGVQGGEQAKWVADLGGRWTIELVPRTAAAAGSYEIHWGTRRAANESDSRRLVADSLSNVGLRLSAQGRYAEAEPLYVRALATYGEALGTDNDDYGRALHNLATLFIQQGRYAEAEPITRRALSSLEKGLGPDHADVANSLVLASVLYIQQGRFADAEPLSRRALEIYEKTRGRDHPDVAVVLSNLAVLYVGQGRHAQAEPLSRRALAITERALGPDHPSLASMLNGLSLLYFQLGRYAEAVSFSSRALAISEKAYGAEHPEVATSLNNLAVLHVQQGRYGEAEPLYRRALAIREKSLGAAHPSVATSLNNLAVLYGQMRRYADAESLFHRALSIREKTLGAENATVATTLFSLAGLYRREQRYAQAESLYRRSLAIREKALGLTHRDVAQTLTNLAATRSERGGDVSELIPLLDRAIAIIDDQSVYPEVRIEAYALRARIEWGRGERTTALRDLAESIRSAEQQRPQTDGGEQTRASYFGRFAEHFERMVAWQVEAGNLERALEYSERGRARVLLDQLAADKIDLRQSIPADVRTPLEAKEASARARVSEYQQRLTRLPARRDLSAEEKARQIGMLEDSLRLADREFQMAYEEMKSASPLWRDLITAGGQPVSLATIQRRLVPTSGYMLLYQIGVERSFVFVIPPVGKPVEAFPLSLSADAALGLGVPSGPLTAASLERGLRGDSVPIDESSAGTPGISALLARAPSTRALERLDRLQLEKLHALWRVLMPPAVWRKIKSADEVIIVPGRGLYTLPFEALVVQGGARPSETRYWLDDGPAVRYAASATTLYGLEQRPAGRAVSSATSPAVLSLSNPAFDPAQLGTPPSGGMTGPETSQNASRREGPLSPLPGTAAETEAIRIAFGGEGKGAVMTLQGRDATEARLRDAMAGKRYLHLATHGLVDETRGALFAALALTPPPTAGSASDNDGFLQLHEIYELKLPDAELAVLSACETNAGTALVGEGIFALSRGFLAAGARRVIASEWAVEDRSTAELIGTFFRAAAAAEVPGRRVNYALALRAAKRAVRQRPGWSHPYYWAPFVLIGKQ